MAARLKQGYRLRDSACDNTDARMGTEFHGVYSWTYQDEDSIKDKLDQGLNAILVNAGKCCANLGSSPSKASQRAKIPPRPPIGNPSAC